MKTGLTLIEMATEIERQRELKRDFVADTREMRLVAPPDDSPPVLHINGFGDFGMKPQAHAQVAARLDIYKPFYDRLLKGKFDAKGKPFKPAHPDLLAMTVNKLFHDEPERRLIRVLDDDCRAFLSDGYRMLDNYDCANAVIPVLREQPEMEIVSTQLTDERFYIKAVFPKIEGEVKIGDVVQSGVVISNSEVGKGAVSVRPMLYRLWCLNGCTTDIGAKRKFHTGKRADSSEEAFEIYSDKTKELSDIAFWSQIKDLVRNCTQQSTFDRILEEIQKTTGQRITGDPIKTVELTAKKFNLRSGEESDVLRHLIDGGDLTRYGLLNAITRTSQDVEDYDRASQLERLGGRIIELPQTDWTQLAEAA
jgi:hypothetical protein